MLAASLPKKHPLKELPVGLGLPGPDILSPSHLRGCSPSWEKQQHKTPPEKPQSLYPTTLKKRFQRCHTIQPFLAGSALEPCINTAEAKLDWGNLKSGHWLTWKAIKKGKITPKKKKKKKSTQKQTASWKFHVVRVNVRNLSLEMLLIIASRLLLQRVHWLIKIHWLITSCQILEY